MDQKEHELGFIYYIGICWKWWYFCSFSFLFFFFFFFFVFFFFFGLFSANSRFPNSSGYGESFL